MVDVDGINETLSEPSGNTIFSSASVRVVDTFVLVASNNFLSPSEAIPSFRYSDSLEISESNDLVTRRSSVRRDHSSLRSNSFLLYAASIISEIDTSCVEELSMSCDAFVEA